MKPRVCPWWIAFTFDNPLRRCLHDPQKILEGLIATGQTVIDLGCGMGYFSIPMARMVGETGQVIAADLQAEMLQRVQRRAARVGVEARIHLHRCRPEHVGIQTRADFVLAFWMVHEVPNQRELLREIREWLKPTGRFLLVEPKFHVPAAAFQRSVASALDVGLKPCAFPPVRFSRTVLFSV